MTSQNIWKIRGQERLKLACLLGMSQGVGVSKIYNNVVIYDMFRVEIRTMLDRLGLVISFVRDNIEMK